MGGPPGWFLGGAFGFILGGGWGVVQRGGGGEWGVDVSATVCEIRLIEMCNPLAVFGRPNAEV